MRHLGADRYNYDRFGQPHRCPRCIAATPPGDGNTCEVTVNGFRSVLAAGRAGVDRFYLGYTGLGVLKLVTLGGCGIWALVDFIMVGMFTMKDAQGNSLKVG